MTKTNNTAQNNTANIDLVAEVKAHAETYKDNGRGWDILLDEIASGEIGDDMLASIIGKTKSAFKAKNNVYRFLQPIVKLRKAENSYEAAVA